MRLGIFSWFIVTALLTAGLVRLGLWQVDRAHQKQAAYARYLAHQRLPPVPLQDVARAPIEELNGRAVTLAGRYAADLQVLLDNQSHRGLPGYLVLTPFALKSGETVLINRGWLPMGRSRNQVAIERPPAGDVTLRGTVAGAPARGLLLRGAEQVETLPGGVRRVQYVDYDMLTRVVGTPLLHYLVLLDPQAPGGYVREWTPPGSDEYRHWSYAVQWFAMAAAVLILFMAFAVRGGRRAAAG